MTSLNAEERRYLAALSCAYSLIFYVSHHLSLMCVILIPLTTRLSQLVAGLTGPSHAQRDAQQETILLLRLLLSNFEVLNVKIDCINVLSDRFVARYCDFYAQCRNTYPVNGVYVSQ